MRFLKEILALLFIIIFIIGTDIFFSRIVEKSVGEIDDELNIIIEQISKEEKFEKIDILEKVEKFEHNWNKIEEKLSYFVEHNELEKVTEDIVIMKANVNMEEREDAYQKMEEIKFKIEHIKNKQKLKLNNIF